MQQKISFGFKLVIVLVWALPQMSTDIYLPSMPSMAHYFSTNLSMIQYTIFYYTVGFSLGAIFFGPISDRIGRRPVILWSLVFAALGCLLALFANTLNLLYIARLLQGIALVGVGSTMRAVTKDICSDKEEMAKFGAVLGIVIPIASAMAPVIGGYIEQYSNWKFSFVFLLAYIIIFLIYTIKVLPETNLNKLERPFKYLFLDYKEVLTSKRFLSYNLISTFAMCSMFAYITLSPYLLQVEVGLSPEKFGYTNLLISFTLIISSYINTKLIYHYGIDKMLRTGAIFLATGGVFFLLCGIFSIVNIYAVIIPMIIMVTGCGFIYPNASAGGLSIFDKSAGTAGAVYAFVQMIGGSLGSGFISLMSHHGDPKSCLGLFIIVVGILGVLLSRYLMKTDLSTINVSVNQDENR